VWIGNAIRFVVAPNGSGKPRVPCREMRIETCAAAMVKRFDIERNAREKSAPGSHTEAEWSAILQRYGSRCLCCGAEGVTLAKDHVIPLSDGGSNSASNLQPLCGPCNSSKGARIIDFRTRATA
jgi:5-methylcytosine-specific restriction endonuclease McrA